MFVAPARTRHFVVPDRRGPHRHLSQAPRLRACALRYGFVRLSLFVQQRLRPTLLALRLHHHHHRTDHPRHHPIHSPLL